MLPTDYQNFIHYSKYSRWRDDLQRRETWEETVQRYVDFFKKYLLENNVPIIYHQTFLKELEKTKEKILNLEVVPSMRALKTAGPALEKHHAAGYNCLAGHTEFLTKEYGITTLKDTAGKTVTVISDDNQWHLAKIKKFGKQKLYKVVFKPLKCKYNKNILATLDHNWKLLNGKTVSTGELHIGDKIKFAYAPKNIDITSIDYRRGVQHGLIYGDGTKRKNDGTTKLTFACERTKGYVIRICSDYDNILKWFDEYPKSKIEGDPLIFLYDAFAKTHLLKKLPSITETDDYLVGFFRGWFAADGTCGN